MAFNPLDQSLDYRNIANIEMAIKAANNNTVVNHVTAIKTFKQNNYLDDPLFLGYRPFFHYTENNGLLASETFTNSALAYLKRIGENTRYEALKLFIGNLQKVNVDMPYMFQTIEGLMEAKMNFNKPINNENNFIVFGMLESLDMRIQGLLQTYKMIAYDTIRHVWVLPRNLRQFSMSVVVYPIGVYDVTTEYESESIPNSKNEGTGLMNPADNIIKFNHIMFEFSQCEFDVESSGQGFFDSVNNQEIIMANTSIGVSYKRVRESGVFKYLLGNNKISGNALSIAYAAKQKLSNNKVINYILDAAAPVTQDIVKLKERFSSLEGIKQGFTEMFGGARQYLEDNAQAFLANQINRLYLGNVYETSVSDIVALVNSRGIENTIINLGRAADRDPTRNTSGQQTQQPSNVYQ